MKEKMFWLAVLSIILAGVIKINADTVNPTSNVLGDSANTATTLVYRDSSGNFAANGVTLAGTTASKLVMPAGIAITTTAFLTVVAPAGAIYLTYDSGHVTPIPFALCHSTGGSTAANLVLSSQPTVSCRNTP